MCLFAENPDFDPLKIAAGEEQTSQKKQLADEHEDSKVALVSSVNLNGPNATVVIRNNSKKPTSGQFKVKFLTKDGSVSRTQLINAYVEAEGSDEFGFYLASDETHVIVEPIKATRPKAASAPRQRSGELSQESVNIPQQEQSIDFEAPTDNQ